VLIQLHNTLTKKKEAFQPLDPENVRVYVCGPTVYDLAHIGNARPVVVFDVLFRLLRHVYGAEHVTYARNITDVDDKIIKAAGENGEPIDALTARTTQAFHDDAAALGALEPSIEPRATGHIPEMIALIESLIERGNAYSADGHVLFDVPSDPNYGCLSHRNRDEMIAGARVEVAPYKQDPADFVLWKPSSPEQPGWDSPWGRGRPGWHIECSAMSAKHLGETFDIHGGGQDLIFPHHENEIAQSSCGTDGGFARLWMHNGYVIVGGEKMSKSLGNFLTVRQILEEKDWPGRSVQRGEIIRLSLLSAHYRQPLDITRERLGVSKTLLDRWYRALEACGEVEPSPPDMAEPGVERFLVALKDDLNTPQAIAEINNQADLVFQSAELPGDVKADMDFGVFKGNLRFMGSLVGLLEKDPEFWFKGQKIDGAIHPSESRFGPGQVDKIGTAQETDTALPITPIRGPSDDEIEAMIAARTAARQSKDFAEADRIRDELAAQGVLLEDGAEGTTWKRG
jgi:cysteinyl-tRNA synthetase